MLLLLLSWPARAVKAKERWVGHDGGSGSGVAVAAGSGTGGSD